MAELKIDVIVDDHGNLVLQGLQGHVSRVESSLTSLNRTADVVKNTLMGLIGVYSARQALNIAQTWFNEAEALGAVADAAGISTRALQQYHHAAKQNEISTEQFDSMLKMLAKRLGEAQGGTGTLVSGLKNLDSGLLSALQSTTDTGVALDLIFKRMDAATSASERAAIATTAFGRSGIEMSNIMRGGWTEVERLKQEAESLGIVLDERLIRDADRVSDQFSVMSQVIKTNLMSSLLELSPQLIEISKSLTGNFLEGMKLFKENFEKIKILVGGFIAFELGSVFAGIGASALTAASGVSSLAAAMAVLKATTLGGWLAGAAAGVGTIGAAGGAVGLVAYGAIKASDKYIASQQPYKIIVPGAEQGKQSPLALPGIELPANWQIPEHLKQKMEIPGLTPAELKEQSDALEKQTAALKEMQAIVDKFNLTPYEQAVKNLDEQFEKLKGTLGDTPEVMRAYQQALIGLNMQFSKAGESKINQQLQTQGEIVSAIKPNMDSLVASYANFLDQFNRTEELKKIQWIFDDLSSGITDSFTNAFREILAEGKVDFEALGKSIRNVFADVAADLVKQKFIQPAISGLFAGGNMGQVGYSALMANWTGGQQNGVYPSNFVGPLPQGGATYAASTGSQAMGGLGAGSMAYGMTGSPAVGLGAGIGYLAGGLPGAVIGGAGTFILEKLFEDEGPSLRDIIHDQLFDSVTNTLASAVAEGLRQGLSDSDFETLIKDTIGNTIINTLIDTMAISSLQPIINKYMAPFLELATTKQTLSTWEKQTGGEIEIFGKSFYAPNLSSSITPEMMGNEAMNIDYEGMANEIETVFGPIREMLGLVKEALGINTDATVQNTDAILGPIESLMRDLQVGSLAPAQSIEGYQAEYKKLFEGIKSGEVDTSTFATFAREYLDFSRAYGGYGGTAGGMTGDLQSIIDTYRTPATVQAAPQNSYADPYQNPAIASVDARYQDPNFRAAQESRKMTIEGTLKFDKNGTAQLVGYAIKTDPEVREEIRRVK